MIHIDRKILIADKYAIGTKLAALTDTTLLESPGKLYINAVSIDVPTGLASDALVTLKDGATIIGTWKLATGQASFILSSGSALLLNSGKLVAYSDTADVIVSAWGVEQ